MAYSISALLLLLVGAGCAYAPPKPLSPVSDFKLDRYLGTWYEIARLDHSFERGLSDVTAAYSMRDDGLVRVINRGYDQKKGEFRQAVGRAKVVGDPGKGQLKVSFFGPFYAPYNVVALDPDYQFALVCSTGTDYLWILARKPTLPQKDIDALLAIARSAGFETDKLIYPSHHLARLSPAPAGGP